MDETPEHSEQVGGIPADAARRLIGPRADYYLSRWANIGERGVSLGLNWPAFLFGPFWMLYRRMYRTFWALVGAALLLGVIQVLAAHLLGITKVPEAVQRVLSIMLNALVGVFGTYWYFLEVRRRYERIRAFEDVTDADFDHWGGVSWGAAMLGLTVLVMLILVGAVLTTPGG